MATSRPDSVVVWLFGVWLGFSLRSPPLSPNPTSAFGLLVTVGQEGGYFRMGKPGQWLEVSLPPVPEVRASASREGSSVVTFG